MAEPLVIPDASVILKWVLPSADEADADRALALRDAIASGVIHALAPDLWLYEVGNTLARRLPEQAGLLLDVLVRFDLPRALPSRKWRSQVHDLTRRYGVTFYDAAYHAHAILERGVFVTADERYFQQAGKASFILPLSEWGRATQSASPSGKLSTQQD